MSAERVYRFRPRYRGVAWTSIGVGGSLAGVAVAIGFATLPFVTGTIGVALGLLYLGSPAWKLEVVTDDAGLEVRTKSTTKFRLAWGEVRRVVVAPTTNTCFVDGGVPENSLLVSGVGAPAPYAIENSAELVATILERVTPDCIERVDSLESVGAVPSTK